MVLNNQLSKRFPWIQCSLPSTCPFQILILQCNTFLHLAFPVMYFPTSPCLYHYFSVWQFWNELVTSCFCYWQLSFLDHHFHFLFPIPSMSLFHNLELYQYYGCVTTTVYLGADLCIIIISPYSYTFFFFLHLMFASCLPFSYLSMSISFLMLQQLSQVLNIFFQWLHTFPNCSSIHLLWSFDPTPTTL